MRNSLSLKWNFESQAPRKWLLSKAKVRIRKAKEQLDVSISREMEKQIFSTIEKQSKIALRTQNNDGISKEKHDW